MGSDAETAFPIYASGRHRRWAEHAKFDMQLGELLANDLIWAVRPALREGEVPSPSSRGLLADARSVRRGELSTRAALGRVSHLVRKRPLVKACKALVTDGHLKLWTTENQAKALFGTSGVPARFFKIQAKMPRIDLTRANVRELAAEVAERSHIELEWIVAALAGTQLLGQALNECIQRINPTSIVTASQTADFCRVSILLGREFGIPTVYIPHAATATNRYYADIPHDLALLRGERDRDYYLNLGGRPAGLEVVGVPEPRGVESVKKDESPLVVFATSADRPRTELLEALTLMRDVARRSSTEVVVAPHPREREIARVAASQVGLRVATESTRDVLNSLNVVAFISERSSSSMMDALYVGIPSLRLAGSPNYLFEDAFEIRSARTPDDLLQFVLRAVEGALPRPSSDMATSFVSSVGRSALANIGNRLEEPILSGKGVLDSWKVELP